MIRLPDYNEKPKIYLAQCFFYLGIIAKPFYLAAPGSFQLSDLLMMIGCALYIFVTKKAYYDYDKSDTWFYLFLVFVFLVNSIYFIVLKNDEFIRCMMFYIYNGIIIFTFSGFMREENRPAFLQGLGFVLKLSMTIQGILYLTGIGHWMDGVRYIGLFTDPNQYGVFIFFSVLQIYITDHLLGKRSWIIWSVIGTLLLLPSASTGTMLGMVLFWVGLYFSNFRSMRRVWKLIWGALTGLLILTFLVLGLGVELPKEITSHFMYERVMEKFNKVSGSTTNLIRDRAWNRIVDEPEYFLYGSGEGYNKRFNDEDLELHSSILAPAHAYGIIPYIFLVIWVFKKARHTRFLFIYIALFGEAMFVVNTRQPAYWMLIILAGIPQAEYLAEAEQEEPEPEKPKTGKAETLCPKSV